MFSKNTLFPYTPKQNEMDVYESLEKNRGRIERRKITTSTIDPSYFEWEGNAQVFEITRTREIKGKTSVEVAYGVTSLPPSKASAEKLHCLVRRHWSIENTLHHVRDVTFNEDRCRVRHHGKAQILAAVRNIAISILHKLGFSNMVEGRELCADNKTCLFNCIFKRTE